MSDLQPKNILIYRADDNNIRLEVKLEEKTIWLSQKQIGELYQKSKGTISEHIKNIFQDGELEPEATVRKFRTVQKGDHSGLIPFFLFLPQRSILVLAQLSLKVCTFARTGLGFP